MGFSGTQGRQCVHKQACTHDYYLFYLNCFLYPEVVDKIIVGGISLIGLSAQKTGFFRHFDKIEGIGMCLSNIKQYRTDAVPKLLTEVFRLPDDNTLPGSMKGRGYALLPEEAVSDK